MPWHAFADLTADDGMAIAAFLQSVKPVDNRFPARSNRGKSVEVHAPDNAAGRNRSRAEMGRYGRTRICCRDYCSMGGQRNIS
jgi:hypothetical protein